MRLFGIAGGYIDVTTIEAYDEETGTYGPAKPRTEINPETLKHRAPDLTSDRAAILRALVGRAT